MGQDSKIEWTHHTFNCWWGCQKVSPGCEHCYANTLAKRYGHNIWGPAKTTERRLFGDKHWAEPLKWNRAAEKDGERRRVFCASMADVFEDHPQVESERTKLWALIEQTPWLDWLLLTKRPENVNRMTPWGHAWPDNIWLGTSAEDQARADLRIPELCRTGAKVLFLSIEPLLGPIDLRGTTRIGPHQITGHVIDWPWLCSINWVIVGAESGHDARSMNLDWVRALRDQCQQHGEGPIPFFFKQAAEKGKKISLPELDGRTWDQFPEVAG